MDRLEQCIFGNGEHPSKGGIYEIIAYSKTLEDPEAFIEQTILESTNYESEKKFIFSLPVFEEQKIIKNSQIEKRKNGIKYSISDIECRKCHKKKVFEYSKQTKSGDEGMTTFYKCMMCKAAWK
jgi:DNA-directed RNA polymerase subunit M/transcription elongation factor TFIIS